MDLRDQLREIRERAEGATDGPWERVERRFEGGRIREHSVETHAQVIADDLSLNAAEFIAHARTDVPRLVEALEGVLGMHRPMSGYDGIAGEEYETCAHCMEAGNEPSETPWDYRWPCPTVRSITAALEAS